MDLARVGDVELEYEVHGEGDPVVFIHGAFIADTMVPLRNQAALGASFRLVFYRRRGYAGSSPVTEPVSIGQGAADCAGLLDVLGIARAHVVGHSYGGCVALQLAVDRPELVQSLALLEPGLAVGESGPGYREALAGGIAQFHAGDPETVVDGFLEARWAGYREGLDAVLPGAFGQAVTDAATSFDQELGELLTWMDEPFPWDAITQPTLSVVGGASNELWPRFGETHEFLLSQLDDAEGFVVPGATHFLHLESAERGVALAGALADFFGRHPITAAR